MLDLAKHIIKTKQGAFDPRAFHDRYEEALAELVKPSSRASRSRSASAPAADQAIVDLMQALRDSAGAPAGRRQIRRPRRRRAGRRDASESKDRSAAAQGGLTRWRSKPIASKRDFKATAEPQGGSAPVAEQRQLRHPEARRAPAALRSAAGDGRRAQELGGDARAEPGAGREAAGGRCRGSPARIRRLRRHDPQGRIWRRHGHRLGSRRWTPIGDPHKGLQRAISSSSLTARSCTAAGIWSACAGKPREKRENWLLIKGDDEDARAGGDADILEEQPEIGEDRPRGG